MSATLADTSRGVIAEGPANSNLCLKSNDFSIFIADKLFRRHRRLVGSYKINLAGVSPDGTVDGIVKTILKEIGMRNRCSGRLMAALCDQDRQQERASDRPW